MRVAANWVFVTLGLLLAPSLAYPCSCVSAGVADEKKGAALVFAGKVTELKLPDDARGEYYAQVTFEVFAAWKGRPAEFVTVITEPSGVSCGYLPAPGGYYLIFAHRTPVDPRLEIGLCSNNQPLLCAEPAIRELGRRTIERKALPSLEDVGSDDAPLPQYVVASGCARRPEPPEGADLALPDGVKVRGLSATILRNGTVRELSFRLECKADVAAVCTPELERKVRDTLLSWRYRPGTLHGRPVALQMNNY